MSNVIWTLAVNTECGEPASVSIHPTYDAAIEWLRSGWDVDGHFDHLDGDGLVSELAFLGIAVSTDAHDLDVMKR